MDEKRPDPNPENPETLLDLQRSAPEDAAAGMAGVFSGMKFVLNELPLGRGIKALSVPPLGNSVKMASRLSRKKRPTANSRRNFSSSIPWPNLPN
jgi:hypothetical protein